MNRYFFTKLTITFLVTILSLFSLYCLIDSTMHTPSIHYYLIKFCHYSDKLISFSFLIAFMRTLLSANYSRELVALQTGGISLRKISKPYFLFAILLTIIGFFLSEKKTEKLSYELADHTTLVYESYDPIDHTYHDLFWIRSPDDIWHIETLQGTLGTNVNHFFRNHGILSKEETYPTHTFHLAPFITKKEEISFTFLTPLLIVIALFPFCIRYSRNTSSALLYAIALFSLFTFFTLVSISAVVLFIPFLVFSPLFLYRVR